MHEQINKQRETIERLDELIRRDLSPAQVRVLLRRRQMIYWQIDEAMRRSIWGNWTMYCPFDESADAALAFGA